MGTVDVLRPLVVLTVFWYMTADEATKTTARLSLLRKRITACRLVAESFGTQALILESEYNQLCDQNRTV